MGFSLRRKVKLILLNFGTHAITVAECSYHAAHRFTPTPKVSCLTSRQDFETLADCQPADRVLSHVVTYIDLSYRTTVHSAYLVEETSMHDISLTSERRLAIGFPW